MLTRDGKDVGFTWKKGKSQFHARRKLKSVDFRSKYVKMLIFMLMYDGKDVGFTWKTAKSQFRARRKLESVNFS